MLIFSAIFWTLIAFYFDKVLPRQYGERLPACFCFKRKYYSCCNNNTNEFEEVFDAEDAGRRSTLRDSKGGNIVDPFELKYLDKENYEAVAPEIARMELENQVLKI